MALPKQMAPEGLDNAAKIKIGIASVALLVAGVVLVTYVFDISLFGGSKTAEKGVEITPEVKEERKVQIQEIKKEQEQQQQKNPNVHSSGA